jgi:hypothetical protein
MDSKERAALLEILLKAVKKVRDREVFEDGISYEEAGLEGDQQTLPNFYQAVKDDILSQVEEELKHRVQNIPALILNRGNNAEKNDLPGENIPGNIPEAPSGEGGGKGEVPPTGHPLQVLGARLAELLDADQWNNLEPLLLESWRRAKEMYSRAPSLSVGSLEALREAARKAVDGWDKWDTDVRTPPSAAWIRAMKDLEGALRGVEPAGETRKGWSWISAHWKYHAEAGSANVWPNGTWHTFDTDGVGGENSSETTIPMAMEEAEKAIARQGWDKEPDEAGETAGAGSVERLENYRSTMWYARTFIQPDALGKPVIEALEKHCAEIEATIAREAGETAGAGSRSTSALLAKAAHAIRNMLDMSISVDEGLALELAKDLLREARRTEEWPALAEIKLRRRFVVPYLNDARALPPEPPAPNNQGAA